MKALVTGATGFIGRYLCERLSGTHVVRAAVRGQRTVPGTEVVDVGDLAGPHDWRTALREIDVVFHLAGLAHLTDRSDVRRAQMFAVNAEATKQLALAAKEEGVRRFVFLSSAKVNGESSSASGFVETDTPAPHDDYARSKLLGEQHVAAILDTKATVVRTPLVYGAGVRANFLSLMRMVDRRYPLPLASVRNIRSFIFAANLADALVTLAEDPRAGGELYFVSDFDDVSTPDLIRRIGTALQKNPLLFRFPPAILRAGAALAGRGDTLQKLIGSLHLNTAKIAALGWRPPHGMDEGLAETAKWMRDSR